MTMSRRASLLAAFEVTDHTEWIPKILMDSNCDQMTLSHTCSLLTFNLILRKKVVDLK